MARSRYVWTVQNDVGVVVGAFTVRRELVRSLEQWNDPTVLVTRCDTAGPLPHDRIEIPASELLAGG